MSAPATRVMHRQLQQVPPTAAKGDGVFLVDTQGKRYLDASAASQMD